MLVYLSGHLQAVPIYIKWRDGRIVGAFNMQNFWPLPLIALYVEGAALAGTEPLIMMPAWWPLLPSAFGKGFTLYMLAAVLAALGYSDLAVTHSVRQKTKSAHLRRSDDYFGVFGRAKSNYAFLSGFGGTAWARANHLFRQKGRGKWRTDFYRKQ